MEFNRYAYFFLNIFEKIDEESPNWDHLSKLIGFLHEILNSWNEESLFDDRIIKLGNSIYKEFNHAIEDKRKLTTVTINDIEELNTLIEKFIQSNNK
ncbi:hypothetical protein [Sphingobacterium cellulitidis]|uniref:hypothetical protein n=1 Tax=Sphingobacterium cellulitidis TaxID=1768011 RepID=UPI00146F286A